MLGGQRRVSRNSTSVGSACKPSTIAHCPKASGRNLIRKLTAAAADRHIKAAEEASRVFDTLLDQRLIKPDGKRRNLAVLPTGEVIDRYGRLLAYLAPWFANTRSDPLPPRHDPERRTFNLNMIENGWAAFFPVYPSLPPQEDWNLTVKAAERAWAEARGAWKAHGRRLLLAYEYRMCIKLGTAKSAKDGIAEAFQRICVDLRDRRVVGKYDFYKLDPPHRLWVWQEHVEQAKADLGLHA